MKAVVAEKLSKTYTQGKKAVNGLSLTLEQGEIFGFLGPNGSGKTTTVKLLGGMLLPTEGTCRVFGVDPEREPERVHGFSGVVMYDHLTGLQNLIFFGRVFGMSGSDSQARAKTLLKSLELTHAKDQKLGTYSTGMRQRLSLARAMMHRPKILFLDEPTSGLDPESAQNVNSIIKSLAADQNITIFLCTHQLRYAQEICSSYGLIDQGTLLATGGLAQLRSLVHSEVTVRIVADGFPEDLPHKKTGERTLEMRLGSEEEIPPIVKRIVERGGSVYHVSAREPSLEEIYFSLLEMRKSGRGGGI